MIKMIQVQHVVEQPWQLPLKPVQTCQSVLPDSDENVHAYTGGNEPREHRRKVTVGQIVGMIEEVLVELVQHEIDISRKRFTDLAECRCIKPVGSWKFLVGKGS